jgi:hypothetical protein
LATPLRWLPAGQALKPELFHTDGITPADFAALHYRGVDPNVSLVMLGCCADADVLSGGIDRLIGIAAGEDKRPRTQPEPAPEGGKARRGVGQKGLRSLRRNIPPDRCGPVEALHDP